MVALPPTTMAAMPPAMTTINTNDHSSTAAIFNGGTMATQTTTVANQGGPVYKRVKKHRKQGERQ